MLAILMRRGLKAGLSGLHCYTRPWLRASAASVAAAVVSVSCAETLCCFTCFATTCFIQQTPLTFTDKRHKYSEFVDVEKRLAYPDFFCKGLINKQKFNYLLNTYLQRY